ncbi:MAG: dihydrolipoyl dehydrogenase [Oscillospiraceae bacterium]|nr:dihydrolipoyl dehydrogenase [Oscillospiraceae bacterium]
MSAAYDLIVIGGGPGGSVAALRAAKLGMRTALLERAQLGGTCLNRGCVPTKALLHAAELAAQLRRTARWGIHVESMTIDRAQMLAAQQETVTRLRDGLIRMLAAAKVDVLAGTGTLLPGPAVSLAGSDGSQVLPARHVLLATGSVPVRLPLPGADLPRVLSSDDLLTTGETLQSLLIVGGGVIGVEFASLYADLGAAVTLIEVADRLLPTMDRELSQSAAMLLKKHGVCLRLGATVQRFAPEGEGILCGFTEKGESSQAVADATLVCVGRRPYTEALIGPGCPPEVQNQRGAIPVDDRGRTAMPGVWACGDVTGGVQLAHYASAQGIAAVEDMAGVTPTINLQVVPSCVYTEPEIASVGMTADDARAAGRAVRTGKQVLGGNARTLIQDVDRAFIKVVADADTGALLGAQLMCPRASDLVAELALAITQRLTLAQLAGVMRAHPTFGEAVGEAIEAALR